MGAAEFGGCSSGSLMRMRPRCLLRQSFSNFGFVPPSDNSFANKRMWKDNTPQSPRVSFTARRYTEGTRVQALLSFKNRVDKEL